MDRAFSIACLCLTLLLVFHHVRSQDVVQDPCPQVVAGDPKVSLDFCVGSLGSNPRSQTADFEGLGLMALTSVQANVTGAIDYMNKLLQQPLDPSVKSAVSRWSGLYAGSVQPSRGTIPAYQAKSYDMVQTWVPGVLTNVGACESQIWDSLCS